MTSDLFMKIACGHNGTLRCPEEDYCTGEPPLGYIAYKINTCAPPGRRDLSAYSSIIIITYLSRGYGKVDLIHLRAVD